MMLFFFLEHTHTHVKQPNISCKAHANTKIASPCKLCCAVPHSKYQGFTSERSCLAPMDMHLCCCNQKINKWLWVYLCPASASLPTLIAPNQAVVM